jgi:hypothetical protein
MDYPNFLRGSHIAFHGRVILAWLVIQIAPFSKVRVQTFRYCSNQCLSRRNFLSSSQEFRSGCCDVHELKLAPHCADAESRYHSTWAEMG